MTLEASGVEPGGPLRDRLAARRRQTVVTEITDVALRLFGERGFEHVPVEDIAVGAGISQRTFFRYFASKDDVLLQFERHLAERLVTALEARPVGEGPVTALRAAFVATSTVSPEQRERTLVVGRLLADTTRLRDRVVDEPTSHRLVAAVAARMGVAPETDGRPAIVTAALRAAAHEAFARWVADGGPGDAADRVDAALRLLHDGLGALDRQSRRSA